MVNFYSIIKKNKLQTIYISILIMLVVATGIPFPLLLKLVIDAVSNKKGSINLGTTCIFFLVLVISQLVFNFILSVCSSRWSQSIAYNLRNRIYKSRINSDVNALSNENDMAQTAIISDLPDPSKLEGELNWQLPY